jgi:D-alanyl-D-alanine carboxypeptidase
MPTQQERPTKRPRIGLARALLGGLLAMGAIAATTGQAYPAAARPFAPSAATGDASLAGDLRADLTTYLHDHASDEHVSAAALSVSLPGSQSSIDVSAGTTRFGGSRPVTPDSVWQIGSNTKAFTSVLLLKLEAQHKLSIHDTLARWLPQYPQWRDVTISSLLDMTSGIPPFEEQPAFMAAFAARPYQEFSKEQLVAYATGAPATSGYRYSNTNYILAEMIIEKATRIVTSTRSTRASSGPWACGTCSTARTSTRRR